MVNSKHVKGTLGLKISIDSFSQFVAISCYRNQVVSETAHVQQVYIWGSRHGDVTSKFQTTIHRLHTHAHKLQTKKLVHATD